MLVNNIKVTLNFIQYYVRKCSSYNYINNKDYCHIDTKNNSLTLKTRYANTYEDFNKINHIIDYYNMRLNYVKLNDPNIFSLVMNKKLYNKNNIIYRFSNLNVSNLTNNFNLLDELDNNYIIKSYKINNNDEAEIIKKKFPLILDIFGHSMNLYKYNNNYNNYNLKFFCNNVYHPIIPELIYLNRGLCDYRFMTFYYNINETINSNYDLDNLLYNINHINNLLRFSYVNHCSFNYATLQHKYTFNLSGSYSIINQLLTEETFNKIKLFNQKDAGVLQSAFTFKLN